jgi:hypothetical protein
MEIIVCIKQIIDPEAPAEQFTLDPATKRQVMGDVALQALFLCLHHSPSASVQRWITPEFVPDHAP